MLSEIAMKGVHSETYSFLIEGYTHESAILFAMPERAMSAIQSVSQENSFAERVVAFAVVKGLSLQQVLFAIY